MPSVLLVTQDLQRAGAQRQCVELALGLKSAPGWDVEVVSLEAGGELDQDLRRGGVALRVIPRRWRWDLTPAWGLAAVVHRKRHDVLHSFLFLPNLYARLARLRHRPRLLVSSLRSTGIAGWPRYAAEILMAPLCDVIIANSEAGARALAARGVSPGRIRVVRNGLDLARFLSPPGTREVPGLPSRIGMVAQMEPRKDHTGLIEAFSLVRETHRGARLILGGDGTLRPRIEEAVRLRSLGDAVDLPGIISRPELLYPTLAVYVQASASEEGTSNSIVEAMASGCPVVATDVGGNSETVLHGHTGLIVPPRNARFLAAAILELLDNPDRARLMGQAGRARAMTVYARDVMVRNTIDVYETFLHDRGHPAGLRSSSRATS